LMYTAHIFSKKQDKLGDFWQGVFPPLTVIGVLFVLVVVEPHYSSAFMLFCSCMAVVFCAGVRIRHLVSLAAVAIPVLIGFLFVKGYRLERIASFQDPFADRLGDGY